MYTSSITAAPVHWESLIDRHEFLALQAMKTKNFSIIKAIVAQSFTGDNEDHAQVLLAITGSDESIEEIKRINVQAAEVPDEAIKTYVAAIEEQKNVPDINADKWLEMMDAQQAKTIEFATLKIKEATDQAKQHIKGLPEAARGNATKWYITGSNWAMMAYDTFSKSISHLVDSIADFMRGIFKAIGNAVDTVKAAVTDAVASIMGWFRSANGGYLSGKNSRHRINFTGKLNWPASMAITSVVLGIYDIMRNLEGKDIRVVSERISKDSDGKDTTTRTTIEFVKDGLQAQDGLQVQDGDDDSEKLRKIWLEAVDRFEKAKHYTPAQ